MQTSDKARLSIGLIERAAHTPLELAKAIRESEQSDENKLLRAMQALEHLTDFFDEAPDKNWYRDYYLLTGDHMQLTEEGWVPASLNTREQTGEEPMEVLDEVNFPVLARKPTEGELRATDKYIEEAARIKPVANCTRCGVGSFFPAEDLVDGICLNCRN